MNQSLLEKAVHYFQAGNPDAALTACSTYLETQPEDHRAHQVMALIRHETGNSTSALVHISRAIELCPDTPDYHANHGAILHAGGDTEGALAAYQRAREAGPSMGGIDHAIGHLLFALDRPGEAADAYRLALGTTPDDAVLHLNLGEALRGHGDHHGAIDSFRKSIALAPNIADSHYNLAVILHETAAFAAARTSLIEAIRLSPGIAVYHIALGKAELALGNRAAADIAFRTALQLDPVGETYNLAETTSDIEAALGKGNLPRADQRCRFAEAELPAGPWWPYLRAEIASRLNMNTEALQWLKNATDAIAHCAPAQFPALESNIAALRAKLADAPPPRAAPTPCYLLIKCWGYGFWSDVSHVLSSLLLAEMTGRTPVLHWGSNSYYTDAPDRDAFKNFYQPLNALTVDDIAASGYDYFPTKWHAGNLTEEGIDIWFGEGSRQSGIYFMNRPEQVVVSDFYTQLAELLTWLNPEHELYGMDVGEAYYTLYRKYFKLQPDIQQEVDSFVALNFGDRPTVGVHIRNIDKSGENDRFAEDQAQIMPTVERLLEKNPALQVFLLTDATEALNTWRQRFGDRVFNADCARTSSSVPLTWRDDVGSHSRLGAEVIKDTYAAAACDQFVGLGCSNVAGMVTTLKRWRPEDLHVIGDISLLRENWLLHDW